MKQVFVLAATVHSAVNRSIYIPHALFTLFLSCLASLLSGSLLPDLRVYGGTATCRATLAASTLDFLWRGRPNNIHVCYG